MQEERRHSAEQAARLNTAYAILKTPLSRARYLVRACAVGESHVMSHISPIGCLHQLYLHGASSTPQAEEDTSIDDPELLSDMLEAREEVAAAVGRPGTLRTIGTRVAGQLSACETDLRLAFAHNDIAQASKLTARLSYLTRLSEDISQNLHTAASTSQT